MMSSYSGICLKTEVLIIEASQPQSCKALTLWLACPVWNLSSSIWTYANFGLARKVVEATMMILASSFSS